MKFLLSLVFILGTVFSVQAKKYDISLNLEKGKTYVMNTKSNMVITQSFNGNEMKIYMEIDGVVNYTVKFLEDNIYVLDVQYTKLKMLMDLPQTKLDFSSGQQVSDTLNNIMSLMFDNLVGKTFELTMNNKGEVIDLKGFKEIIEYLFDNLPASIESQKEQLMTQMNQAFGEDSFKQTMENSTAIFPQNPVKLGDTWTKETTMNSTIEFAMSTVYTLEEVNDDFYLITAVGTIQTVVDMEYQEKNGILMKQELSGNSISDITLYKQTGWIKKSEVKQTISGKSLMKQTPEGEPMEIPMELKGTTTVTDKE